MKQFLFLFFTLLLLASCGNETKKPAATSLATTTAANTEKTYQSIPLERLKYLWENATYMDVVFYELPVAMNQSTLESIRTTLAHISETTPTITPACSKSIGRIFFQVNGKNVESAEIYFQQGCTYYLWLENDKPAYANEFTQAGVDFYNNIFKSVQGSSSGK
jgi:hypothetical protein